MTNKIHILKYLEMIPVSKDGKISNLLCNRFFDNITFVDDTQKILVYPENMFCVQCLKKYKKICEVNYARKTRRGTRLSM
jgi:hypothetical protein